MSSPLVPQSTYLTSPVWYLEIYKLEWSKYVSLIKFLNFDRCVKSFLCLKMTKYGFRSSTSLQNLNFILILE